MCGPITTRVVRDKNGKGIGEAIVNPTLIAEVLSDSTERYDRDGKFEAYKKIPSFEEYVLVSATERRLEVRTRKGTEWSTHVGGSGESVLIHGREFSVEAIYDQLGYLSGRRRRDQRGSRSAAGTRSSQSPRTRKVAAPSPAVRSTKPPSFGSR